MQPQTTPYQPPSEPGAAMRENCTMQAIISGGAGGVLGLGLGAILMPFNSSVTQMETQNVPLREQFRRGFKEMGAQSRSWGKNLMVIGAVFSCSECFLEKTRGRTDRWNSIGGGCIAGGVLGAPGACRSRSSRAASPALTRAYSARSWTASGRDGVCRLCRVQRCARCDGIRPLRLTASPPPRS